jgi:AcrR family transcriptional regulator
MAEACAEYGIGNVTVAHVIDRSGVSRRTFYEIFEDRETCFLAALDEGLARARDYVLPAYEANARWLERIRSCLTALLEFLDEDPLMGRLLVVETLGAGAGADAAERRRRALAAAVTAVDAGRGERAIGALLPPLTAEGVVGGALSVLHERMLEGGAPMLDLAGPLMSMIAFPYMGVHTAGRELSRPVPTPVRSPARAAPANPLRAVATRLTYRTVRVLCAIAEHPGSSNRQVATVAGVGDQGQISKLLSRLHRLGLIENVSSGGRRGAPNAWQLTDRGREVQAAVA